MQLAGPVPARNQDGDHRVLAEVDRCVWSPTGTEPTHYTLHWFRDHHDLGVRRAEQIVRTEDVRLPPGTAAPWMQHHPADKGVIATESRVPKDGR